MALYGTLWGRSPRDLATEADADPPQHDIQGKARPTCGQNARGAAYYLQMGGHLANQSFGGW